MSERKVVAPAVTTWLNSEHYTTLSEFVIRGGRADIVGFKWRGTHEVDCIGVECKPGSTSPRAIYLLLSEQISQYRKSVQYFYLALPERTRLDAIAKFCEINHTGLIVVKDQTLEVVKKVDYVNPSFNHDLFLHKVRPRVVLALCFEEMFGHHRVDLRSRVGWCSTLDKVQFGGYCSDEATFFGVNLEDLRGSCIGLDGLKAALSGVKGDSYLELWGERYFTRGKRTRMPLLSKKVDTVRNEDLDLIVQAGTADTNMHIHVSQRVWENWESLGRTEHLGRISKAKDDFANLFGYFQEQV
jgi:hypothetical protein